MTRDYVTEAQSPRGGRLCEEFKELTLQEEFDTGVTLHRENINGTDVVSSNSTRKE